MSDQNAVGFTLQGDVVNLASLAHLVTGRILKALSDGGVDLYAVAASIWLGKHIQVRQTLESTVHGHLVARKGSRGFLAKALSIGWGHSDVAVEMSRTKAGTNALLLIGAISVGTSHFAAAQCLSELLAVSGREPDQLPSVDVLKPMIAYLAPFVADLGFSKVLQHVTTTAEHAVIRICNHVPLGLRSLGDAPVLAGAIKQLVLTSQRGETNYMVVRQRGAWLATFASHVLGMSVELMIDDTTLWASGGTNGSVVLQIGQQYSGQSTLLRNCQPRIHLIDAPLSHAGQIPISIDYLLADALDAELGHHPSLTPQMVTAVHRAICNLSFTLLNRLRIRSSLPYQTGHKVNGQLQASQALLDTLADFGIPDDTIMGFGDCTNRGVQGWTGSATQKNGLSYLECADAALFQKSCHIHNGYSALGRCLCCHIGGTVHGFASTIIALAQCRYDAAQLRIRADLLNGAVTSSWSRGCMLDKGSSIAVDGRQLLSHLLQLVHGNDTDLTQETSILQLKPGMHILGLSGGAYTIYYTCLLQDDCYDSLGRFLTLSPGRASVGGVVRSLLVEQLPEHSRALTTFDPYTSEEGVALHHSTLPVLAEGSFVEPHYSPGRLNAYMDVILREHEILVYTSAGFEPSRAAQVLISRCVHALLSKARFPPACPHPVDEPYRVQRHLRIAPFSYLKFGYDRDGLILFALRGRKLEQLIQCCLIGDVVFQLSCCLRCAIRSSAVCNIVMAG